MAATEFPEIELALTSTALAGDAGGLYRVASDLMDNGVTFDSLLFDYLMPTERSVGKRWEQGDYLVAEEHAVTATIETVISLLAGMFDQPADVPAVVVATAEGDDHSLPARAVAAHLLFLGHRTTYLGANVPAEDLRSFFETEPPRAVVLSGTITTHLLGARAVIQAAHDIGVPVVVGGKAFGADGRWAESVGADAWVGSLREVSDVIERWTEGAQISISETPELSAELVDLVAVRTTVLAKAEAELAAETGGAVPTRLRDELRLLSSTVEAALLTDDDQVVIDMLTWQSRSLQAHGYDGSLVVDSLQNALDASSNAGGDVLARARQAFSA